MSFFIFISVFLATMCIDALYALYTIRLTERRAIQSALFGTFIHLFTAFTVISYTKNSLYIIPLLMGSFVGTYLVVRFLK
jgi:hypothetical protein